MVTRSHDAANREIQNIGATGTENDLRRVARPDEFCDAATGAFHNPIRFERLTIPTPPIRPAQLTLVMVHGIVDTLRLGPSGGGVIKVNSSFLDHSEPIIRGITPGRNWANSMATDWRHAHGFASTCKHNA
jgi:hypothetical protein